MSNVRSSVGRGAGEPSTAWLDPSQAGERAFVTPEGVDLRLKLASVGQRLLAWLIDGVIIFVAEVVFFLAALAGLLAVIFLLSALGHVGLAGKGAGKDDASQWWEGLTFVVWTLGLFVMRNGYYIFFELGARGATPGKRLMKIRVAARDGGQLTPQAVFSRNALREVELMLPVTLMFASLVSAPQTALACLVWSGVFLILPLVNRDRLRMGDMVAGSWVVEAPRAPLRSDVAVTDAALVSEFAFTEAQLSIYGERELQVLEDVLRTGRTAGAATTREVALRIRERIGWAAPPGERDIAFLEAFYTAQRRKLEAGLLFGKRRRDRHEGAGG